MSAAYPSASSISLALTDFSGFTLNTAAGTSIADFRLSNRSECKVRYVEPLTSTGSFTVTVTSTGSTDPC